MFKRSELAFEVRSLIRNREGVGISETSMILDTEVGTAFCDPNVKLILPEQL